jgi:hypothetical protein
MPDRNPTLTICNKINEIFKQIVLEMLFYSLNVRFSSASQTAIAFQFEVRHELVSNKSFANTFE